METGYSGFSAIAPISLYFYDAASVLAVRQHVPFYEMSRRLGYFDDRVYFGDHREQEAWGSRAAVRLIEQSGSEYFARESIYVCLHSFRGNGSHYV